MSAAKITTPGLTAMGLSVALLWGCFIGEQAIRRSATMEQARILHEMNLLRQTVRPQPVFTPIPGHSRPAVPVKS